jgi:hypothetical protein
MSEDDSLEQLKSLHEDLVVAAEAVKEDPDQRGLQLLSALPSNPRLHVFAPRFKQLLDKPPRKKESRDAVSSGKPKQSRRIYECGGWGSFNYYTLANHAIKASSACPTASTT